MFIVLSASPESSTRYRRSIGFTTSPKLLGSGRAVEDIGSSGVPKENTEFEFFGFSLGSEISRQSNMNRPNVQGHQSSVDVWGNGSWISNLDTHASFASLDVAGRGFSFKFLESSLAGRTCIYSAFPRSGCSMLLLPSVFQISSNCSPRDSKGNEKAFNLRWVAEGNEIRPSQNDPIVQISLTSNWKLDVSLWTSMLQCQYMGPVVSSMIQMQLWVFLQHFNCWSAFHELFPNNSKVGLTYNQEELCEVGLKMGLWWATYGPIIQLWILYSLVFSINNFIWRGSMDFYIKRKLQKI